MSASEKLRALEKGHLRTWPIFRKVTVDEGGDGFARARDIESVMDALPALADVVEAAEDFGFMEASLAAAGIYGEPERLRAALSALNEALGGDVT